MSSYDLPAPIKALIVDLYTAIRDKGSMLPMLRANPVKDWDEMTSQSVLGNALTFACEVNNTTAANEIVEYYYTVRNDELPPKLWIQTANLGPKVSSWCREWVGMTVLEYWRMLLNITDDNLSIAVAEHLHTHLPLKENTDWHQLIALMEPNAELAGPDEEPVPHHNQFLRWWLIRNQPLIEYPTVLPSVAQYAKAIPRFFGEGLGKTMPVVAESEGGPQTTDEVIHQMITMYAGSRYLTRCKMAAAVFPDQVKGWPNYNDTPVHQRYGPVNALTTDLAEVSDTPKSDCCTRYGGCRMLSCQEFEKPDEDGSCDWFTKQCVQCKKVIEVRETAVRLPLLNGGWTGCFCEWYCVSEYIANVGYSERDQDVLESQVERFSLQVELTPIV